MAINANLNTSAANGNATNSREPAVLFFNPNLFGWEPKFGTAITQSDINRSEVLQAVLAAMVELDGQVLPGKAYTFDGISGHFKSAVPKQKPMGENVTIVLTSAQG